MADKEYTVKARAGIVLFSNEKGKIVRKFHAAGEPVKLSDKQAEMYAHMVEKADAELEVATPKAKPKAKAKA